MFLYQPKTHYSFVNINVHFREIPKSIVSNL